MSERKTIIGIDLGTTNSAAAWVDDTGKPRLLSWQHEKIIPSVVTFTPEQVLVGHAARNALPLNPDNGIRSVKRLMGTDKRLSFGDDSYSPVDISAMILTKVKEIAEADLGHTVERAVITVPAYFNDDQRTATRLAGERAGFVVERIINEPTAAALTYQTSGNDGENVIVYDLGGGTFDVSVARIEDGIVEVLATGGDDRLGGDDFDSRLADYVVDHAKRHDDIDLRADKRAFARLLRAVEEAKILLSDAPYAVIDEPFLSSKEGIDFHLNFEITRDRFEELISDLVDETIAKTQDAMDDAGLDVDDIDRILLVGGSTRVALVRKQLEDAFQIEPSGSIHPDECVALGAAIQGALIDGVHVDAVLIDVTAHSLGIAVAEGSPLGIMGDRFATIIPRNTSIPVTKSDVFTTVQDGQRSVTIDVYQGESRTASSNRHLGTFQFAGFKAGPAGSPRIIVTFSYDADGVVHVTASDRASGEAESIIITHERLAGGDEEDERPIIDMEQLRGAGVSSGTGVLLERAAALAQVLSGDTADQLKEAANELFQALLRGESQEEQDDLIEDLEDCLIDLIAEAEDEMDGVL